MKCKACNTTLNPGEIYWDEEAQQHNDLCHVCRAASRRSQEVDVAYKPSISEEEAKALAVSYG